MRWVWYSVALVATLVALCLWLFVFSSIRASSVVSARSVSSGVLPVPVVVRPADPVRAALYKQLREGLAVCSGGFYAVRGEDGVLYQVQTSDGRVPCP